jgi:hypothetical protein
VQPTDPDRCHTRRVARIYALIGVITFVVWVFTLVNVAMSPNATIRRLPKVAWLAIVFFFPMLGTVGWFVFGRPTTPGPRTLSAHERARPDFPEYDRPGRAAAADPEKDAAFLREVRARAEEQRRRYEQQQKRDPEPPVEA